MSQSTLERYAAALKASGDYLVLRRLEPAQHFARSNGEPLKIGLVLDTETTGLDPDTDEVIELAMIKFTFSATGKIHEVIDVFDRLREPISAELGEEISRLTHITEEMVEGRTITAEEVEEFITGAVVVIAHNAAHDRAFCEAIFPIFKDLCWACSYSEIDWLQEGHTSARLGDLLASLGYFNNAHRADSDCFSLLQVLAQTLPESGKPALGVLLEQARKQTILITVENVRNAGSFFRKRGYRWHSDDHVRGWRLERTEFLATLEVDLVEDEFPRSRITLRRVTARTRHSPRA